MHLLVLVFLQLFPIHKKSSGSMEEVTNYTGIALSSLLNNCIISYQYDSLFTNDLHFAYKIKTSTIHCLNSIVEAAIHYVSSAGATHVRLIKSISYVNLLKQFRKLHNVSCVLNFEGS